MAISWALVLSFGVFTTLAVYRNLALLRYRLTPPPAGREGHGDLVSVIVPARNEAMNIRGCLQSVLEQGYQPIQVIVVDDNSSDGTGRVLEQLASGSTGVTAVHGKPLLPGWVGKNHAISQGVALADGPWLVFLDADTRLSPDAIERAVALARQKDLAMLSFLPHHVLESFWERVVQPVVLGVVLAGAPPSLIADPKNPTAGAFGQFILFRRSAYEAIGGHEGVKSEVLEDWRMAQKIKALGLGLAMAEGQDLARVRMYESLSGLWEGWSKNTFLGADKKLSLLLVVLMFVFAIGIWPVGLAIWAVLEAILNGPGLLVVTGAAIYQLSLTCFYAFWVTRRLGLPSIYALGFPLGAAVLVGILINSAYLVLSGRGVTWKGRTYAGD
ncbi:MAG: glycosyltransferase family 2 protein [Dehalococcoidia bacterium]|nr:glycosyltransferase family 2 protein [Dehalococcoidia bacterium]